MISIAVLRQLGQGNLQKKEFIGGYISEGETMPSMVGSMAAGRQAWSRSSSESLHVGGREREREREITGNVVGGFGNLKSHPQ